jgi:CDP-diacylglycerol--serine O-phosphatidyltransferase
VTGLQMEVQPTEETISPRSRRELLVFLLPNLFTTLNLFFGFFSILCSIRSQWNNAALAILLATLFDGLDGRVARMTKTQSAFGEQYDSMSDLLSFGVAPSILMYLYALQPYGRIAWMAAFMYLACAALRLARFNVLKQSTEKRYFQGLPSPVAACTVSSCVLFLEDGVVGNVRGGAILAVMFALGIAMISTVRYRSFKDLNFSSQRAFGVLIVIIGLIVVLSTFPEKMLFPIFFTYLLWYPLAEILRLARRGVRKKGRIVS